MLITSMPLSMAHSSPWIIFARVPPPQAQSARRMEYSSTAGATPTV